ncbi:MAG: anti-sigma factor, partial [Rhodocyclaceae bacterium]
MDMNDEDKELSDLLRAHATRHRPGPGLASSIRTELALLSASAHDRPREERWRWPAWGLAGAGFAFGLLVSAAVFLALRPGDTDSLAAELVTSHVRALMVSHLTDVASSNQHTVKPWFQGKLDYSPPVRDFTDEGFPLVGGRLDYVADRPVAVLIYRRHDHFINLFVWPSSGQESQRVSVRKGYNLLKWRQDGMTYWA